MLVRKWFPSAGLLLSSAIFNLAYTMLIPLVDVLKTKFGMENWEIGVAFGGFAMSKAVFQPVGGFIVDSLKPLPTSVGGLLLVALSLAGLANASTSSHVIVWRLVWGASEGITMPGLYRLVGIIARQSDLAEATLMGWFGSAAVSGMATGVLLAGLMFGYVGYKGTFLVGTAFAVLSAAVLWAALRKKVTLQEPTSDPAAIDVATSVKPLLTRLGWGPLLMFVVVMGVLDSMNNGLYGAIEPLLPLRIGTLVEDSVRTTSILFFAGLVVFAVASALMGRALQRINPYLPILVAFLVSSLSLYGMGKVPNMFVIGGSLILFNIAQPAVYIATRKALSVLPGQLQGRAFGVFGFFSDLGFILGPIVATTLWSSIGDSSFTVLGAASAGVAVAAYFSSRRFRPLETVGL